MGLLVAAVLAVFFVRLYQLQIVEGNRNYEASINSITSHETVIAARGNIMDRYGRLLVSNRNCNNLLIDGMELMEDQEDPNSIILEACALIEANGDH